MKLRFKEDPREWRKSALLTLLGLAILSTLLRWRHVLPANGWYAILAVLAVVALAALLQPRWFRGFYRLSLQLGFYLSQFLGRSVLALLFVFVVTPLGLLLRLVGKEPLQLKRPQNAKTYWHEAKDCGPLDRLF